MSRRDCRGREKDGCSCCARQQCEQRLNDLLSYISYQPQVPGITGRVHPPPPPALRSVGWGEGEPRSTQIPYIAVKTIEKTSSVRLQAPTQLNISKQQILYNSIYHSLSKLSTVSTRILQRISYTKHRPFRLLFTRPFRSIHP